MGTGQKALRAVGGRFFKLWESEGEINRLEHTAGGSQNKATEKLQRTAAPSPLEVGGMGRGKGQTQPQRSHPLPPGKQAPVPGERLPETRPAAALGLHGGKRRSVPLERASSLWLPGPLAAEGKGAPRLGESAHKPLAARAARRGGKRCAAPGERAPKLLAAWREHGECSPHTATSACSAPPSPQQD